MKLPENFSDVCVLIAGDLMLDRYWWGDVNRISPEAPVPVVRLRGDSYAPGGAANVAANVAGLGASPILHGSVGNDPDAEILLEALKSRGISTDSIFRQKNVPTIVKTRIIAHNQQVVRVDRENRITHSEPDSIEMMERIDQTISEADAVIISDYGKGFLSDQLLSHLILKTREHDKPILVDPKGKDFQKYRGATLITPNRREAAEACGLSEDLPDLVDRAGKQLLAETGIENVLITRGEQGMSLFAKKGETFHIPAAAIETYDVTGAGDTVIATLAVACGSGFDLKDAAMFANIAAGIVVQQLGTTSIDLAQVLKRYPQGTID